MPADSRIGSLAHPNRPRNGPETGRNGGFALIQPSQDSRPRQAYVHSLALGGTEACPPIPPKGAQSPRAGAAVRVPAMWFPMLASSCSQWIVSALRDQAQLSLWG